MSNCTICETNFPSTTNKKYCSPGCVAEAARRRYRQTLHYKKCKVCLHEFQGSGNRTMCTDCRANGIPRNFEDISCELQCRQCNTVMGTVTRKRTEKTNTIQKIALCQDCRQKGKERVAEKMRQHNPMRDPKNRERVRNTIKDRWETDDEFRTRMLERIRAGHKIRKTVVVGPETRAKSSQRMKCDNPMKRPEVVEKNIQTRKHNKKSIPKGSANKNWKGNRTRTHTIRTRLYPVWTYPILERSQFKCEVCDAARVKLEVHHSSQTFHQCLTECLNGADIKSLTYEEFEVIVQKVIEAHKTIEGITVCVPCHRLLDKQRH